MTDVIKCRCGTVLLEATPQEDGDERQPCPECGARCRVIDLSAKDMIRFRAMLQMKQKRPGIKKPIRETKSGDELFRKTGDWNRLIRVIDRENDRYYELIENDTGEIIRECDEPLSHHYGRGSAKWQRHDIPEEHLAVAAYFIWEKEGCRDGRHLEHWAMAIENLKRANAGVPVAY